MELPKDTRRTAMLLGAAGVLPFVAGALTTWLVGDTRLGRWSLDAATLYGAVILSFLGGIQWGLILRKPDAKHSLLFLSVLPALLAWAALLLPQQLTLATLILCFPACLLVDFRLSIPAWFRSLRMGLTVVVVASLIALLAATTR